MAEGSSGQRIDRRHSHCARCADHPRGVPFATTASNGKRVVDIRCPVCGLEWKVTSIPTTVPG